MFQFKQENGEHTFFLEHHEFLNSDVIVKITYCALIVAITLV